MWLGLLFSIFALASRFESMLTELDPVENTPPSASIELTRIDFFREKLIQCLILADFFKCPPYTVETFLQYLMTEYLRSQDTQFGTWMIAGMVVRLAFRMGYHREPSRFSNITPFKAEMRRRIWMMVMQTDLMSSSQVGLPRTIQVAMYDTQEPRNLIDEDMSEDMTELPPSRPDSEGTTMLYVLIRTRVLSVFARIMDLTNSSMQPAYREIMELDTTLRAIYDNVPSTYKAMRVKDFGEEITENDMRRFFLGLNFLKGEIMLHRPYLLLGRNDSRYEYSRLACLDAAFEILQFQKIMDTDCRPGGRLWSQKWRLWSVSWRLSSLVAHDFLLATTILCLDLNQELVSPMHVPTDHITDRVRYKSAQPTRTEIVETLTSSYAIWVRESERSHEAQRVATAVSHLLRKANADQQVPPSESLLLSITASFFSFPLPCKVLVFSQLLTHCSLNPSLTNLPKRFCCLHSAVRI
jgi:hypothetical protein